MRILVMCIAIAMLALGVVGCQQAQETVTEEAETMMEEKAEEVMDDMAMVDPVCGMKATEESEWSFEHEGATIYFCSESCRDAFIEEPGKYMKEMLEEVVPS